jgi:hypothetical protein
MVCVIQDGPQYKNAYRGPVRTMGAESNMRPARELVIHDYATEDVPLPLADGVVSSGAGTPDECE